jgi:hypothetical protein
MNFINLEVLMQGYGATVVYAILFGTDLTGDDHGMALTG